MKTRILSMCELSPGIALLVMAGFALGNITWYGYVWPVWVLVAVTILCLMAAFWWLWHFVGHTHDKTSDTKGTKRGTGG